MMLLLLVALWPGEPGPDERAAAAYAEGRFAEAAKLFTKALSLPLAAEGPLLFNLGNCALRLGRPAEARLHFLRALRRLPGDGDVVHNLRLAERELGIDPAPPGVFGSTGLDWLAERGVAEAVALSCSLQLLGFAVLALRRASRVARGSAILVVVLGFAAGAGAIARRAWPPAPQAVVLAPKAVLRPEPAAGFPAIHELRPGESVRVEESSDRWARVDCRGTVGWVETAAIGVVD